MTSIHTLRHSYATHLLEECVGENERRRAIQITLVAWASRPSAENLSSALRVLDSRKECIVSGLGALADPRVAWLTGGKPVPRPCLCHG